VWNTARAVDAPNLSLGAQVGDTLTDRCGRTYGYLGTVNYGYKQGVQRGEVASVRLSRASSA
jgi:hypothetical protein